MAASTQAHDWVITQLQPLLRSLDRGHQVRDPPVQTASRGELRGDVQVKGNLQHNGAPRDFHERWEKADEPSKNGKLRQPADINKPLREDAQLKVTACRIRIPMLTITISSSYPPSLAPPAASTLRFFACYSTTVIGRARCSSALQVS